MAQCPRLAAIGGAAGYAGYAEAYPHVKVGYAKHTLLFDPSIKFGQLILGKISEIVAIRCQILRLKCTKFDFGWGSDPDPAGGAYSAPPDPIAGFKGVLLLREGRGTGEKGIGVEGRGGKGWGGEVR